MRAGSHPTRRTDQAQPADAVARAEDIIIDYRVHAIRLLIQPASRFRGCVNAAMRSQVDGSIEVVASPSSVLCKPSPPCALNWFGVRDRWE
jgi:hypothetical protein